MAPPKSYTYTGESTATVYLAGQPRRVEPGDSVEPSSPAERDSLDANPNFEPAKSGKSKK